jgi:serine/threonine-protein kinase RsbW
MTMADDETPTLCRLDITDRAFLPVAGGVAGDAGTLLGLSLEQASRLRTATHELCAAVAEEGFPQAGPVAIQVSVERRPGSVAVVVTDQGAPSHLTRPGGQPPRLTELLRLGFADELTFVGEGRRGNRAELLTKLPFENVFDALDQAPPEPEVVVPEDVAERIVYRPLEADETLELARLFYRCYGNTAYNAEEVYEPDRLAELVRAGLHKGTVAAVDDRLIAHVSIRLERPDARTGLVGELVVDPAYRRFKVAGSLAMQHAIRLVNEGVIGMYGQAVTVHPASQKLALKFGGHEVAVLLAAQLPSLTFTGIDDETTGRKALIWFYTGMGKEEQRTVHVPSVYREIVGEIYANANLPREIAEPLVREPDDVPAETTLDLQLRAEARLAIIRVMSFGRDFLTALQTQLRELCVHRFEVVLIQLPTNDPLTAVYGGGLHEMGVFFAGLAPEMVDSGDLLILQFLNDIDVNGDEIITASDFGARLRDVVLADQNRTLRTEAERQRSRARLARIYESLS